MTEGNGWQDANTAFLERMVAALRDYLTAAAEGGAASAKPRWPQPAAKQRPPALLLLREAFTLSAFETAVLALCVAHEMDTGIGPLCARATGDPARPWPSFGLAMQLFPPAAWEAVTADGPLRAWRLITVERRGGEPLALSPLRCDERILDFVKGLNRIDDRLALVASEIAPPTQAEMPDDETVETLFRLWSEPGSAESDALLFGGDRLLRQAVAGAAAARASRLLFRLESEALPSTPSDLDQFACLWNREAVLLPLTLLIDAAEAEDAAATSSIRRFIQRLKCPVVVSADRPGPRLAESLLTLEVTRPDADAQQAVWLAALGPERQAIASRLAGAFDFSPATIGRIAASVPRDADDETIWRSCVISVRPRLDALAQRIEPRADWNDLVLPPEQEATLRQIVDQVRQRRLVYQEWGYAARMSRGLGINALFTGDSGTGKTMAAEVLAADLAMNLYRIDLSAVVSKYIGETEKNLRQLFDAAELGGVVLLFDEADALFGKRSEVKDSHDRYANIEVNYLLQRIEAFSGLAILATNMKAALDGAFLRRLRFVVRFPHPGPAERQRMWRRAFPPLVPKESLDYERLGRINLTGGHIVSAALNAAFLAAAGGGRPVTMRDVLQSARAEMVKLNRPITEADFAAPPITVVSDAAA